MRRFEPVPPDAVLSYITLVPAVPAVLPAVAGTAVSEVLLKTSVNPLIIPSVKFSSLTVASSNAVAAVEEFAPLVIPVKVVAVVPV